MLTITPSLIESHWAKAPHHSTSRIAHINSQCGSYPYRVPSLRRKQSEQDLRAMFYSQRVSDRRRRCANPNSFDQSWRKRPLSMQCDIREEVQDSIDEAQTRKRSKTCSTAVFVPSVEDEVIPESRSIRIDSLAPKVDETPQIKQVNCSLLNFVKDLKDALNEDETMDQSDQVKPASGSSMSAPHSDSVIQPSAADRKRRHSFHPSIATKQDLLASRADIKRMARMSNMSRPELSLRREIFYQEQYLRTHKTCAESTPSYRQMAKALTRSRRHLSMYKRRGSEWRDLPIHVRTRIWEVKAQMDGEDETMDVVLEDADASGVMVGQGGTERRRRSSEDADWVSVSYGCM